MLNGQGRDRAERRIGLRTVEVVQEPDSAGKSFYFKVNGVPVFMKGANYIPQDNFLARVTPEHYEHILESVKDAHMNMIRVWGGGIYEDDLFYELCDEKGLLVWQDFMFACAMYPGDAAFLENVRQEAIDNVRRLRNHPSLALWCGNNEILGAWEGGWKEQVTSSQGEEVAAQLWQAYDSLFHHLLPAVVEAEDPGRFYWSSSPSAGTGEPENQLAGDMHYRGVWWGKEPFGRYREHIPRFMSEYGFQSFPELSSVARFARPEDYDIHSEVMRAHQRSSIGNDTIVAYMEQHYRRPKDFPAFLYVGQLLQAEGIRLAMEAHRRNMPWCMGSLYWQINDCWPVASWSGIDYYGKWKALHYFARDAFAEFLLSPQVEEEQLRVYIVSDRLEEAPASLHLRLMNFKGKLLWEQEQPITVAPNQSRVYVEAALAEVMGKADLEKVVLHARLTVTGSPAVENFLYFVPPKALDLPHTDIELEVDPAEEGYRLLLRSDRLAKNVCLQLPEHEGFFSDNYFDLLPDTEKIVYFRTGEQIDDLASALRLMSLVDSYE
jgi:beta-mannosidase